jgi:hypothetical protein
MAPEHLSIPAMSAEPERVLSTAKLTLPDQRCKLRDDVMNALECLKSWQTDGLIPATKADIKEMEEILRALCDVELK